MKLLTKEIKSKLPPLGSQENKKPEETPIVVKFFNPCGQGTWYATEASARLSDDREVPLSEAENLPNGVSVIDTIFFGLANIFESELGYFSLKELESVKLFGGALGIERDMHFGEHMLSEAIAKQI